MENLRSLTKIDLSAVFDINDNYYYYRYTVNEYVWKSFVRIVKISGTYELF